MHLTGIIKGKDSIEATAVSSVELAQNSKSAVLANV